MSQKKDTNEKPKNKFMYHAAADKISDVVGNMKADHIDNNPFDVTETNSMRFILPAFLQNEQKYSEMERARKIQSSPLNARQRRFSQDSAYLDRLWNVRCQFLVLFIK